MMRFILILIALFFCISDLFSQSNCGHYNFREEVVQEIKNYYFKESNEFIFVHPCYANDTLRGEWYSCLITKNNQNIVGDSINLLLICLDHSGENSEFLLVQLLHYISVPERNTPISFEFNEDFLRIVEFKVDSLGLIIEESETDLEPF